ncbi:LexA family protein [Streptomyces sp. NPDC001530]|uniref:LexA family protein n=1 Tax=Streptomyces sp. NPDC001530 TaxID=3364582 RepID=UPI00369A08A7
MNIRGDHLTEREERILKCIRERIAERGEAPTIREIGRSVGLSSPSSVAYHLEQMEQLGVIRRTERRGWGRGIALG